MRRSQNLRIVAAVTVLGAVVPGAVTSASGAEPVDGRSARAVVRNVGGAVLGTLRLDSVGGKIVVSGRLNGLAAGFHGFHVHAVGICDPAATDPNGTVVPFFTAGAHLNPAGTTHGHHAGDMPALLVTTDGTTVTTTQNDALSAALLFDADGSAIIIHASPDNLANIPARYSAGGLPGPDAATLGTGDSGGRVACGVVTRA